MIFACNVLLIIVQVQYIYIDTDEYIICKRDEWLAAGLHKQTWELFKGGRPQKMIKSLTSNADRKRATNLT